MAESVLPRQRSRVREEQRAFERPVAVIPDGRSGAPGDGFADATHEGARPDAQGDDHGAVAVEEWEPAGADASPAHHLSDITVFPREEPRSNGSAGGGTEDDVERSVSIGDPSRRETNAEHEAASDTRLEPETSEDSARAHHFSAVGVFPQQDEHSRGTRDGSLPSEDVAKHTPSTESANASLNGPPDGDAIAASAAPALADGRETAAGAAEPEFREAHDARVEAVEQVPEGGEHPTSLPTSDGGTPDGAAQAAGAVVEQEVERSERNAAEEQGGPAGVTAHDGAAGRGHATGAGRSGGGGARGGAPSADGGAANDTGGEPAALGDAALDRWVAATSAATEAVPEPELPEGEAAAQTLEQTTSTIVNERAAAEPDYESEAKDTQPPVPEAAEKESKLDTSEADQAVAAVAALANKRLSPATFSPIGSPPEYPGLNPRDFVPANDLKVLKDIEDRLAKTDLSAAERVSLTKQLEKVQAHIAGIEAQAMNGTAPGAPVTVLDEGPSSLAPPPPDQAAVLGDAIARAITTIPGRGRALALSAAQPLDQGKSPELQELAAGKADAVEREMREELDQIAAAAGISAEQLTGKIAEQQAAVTALAAAQNAATTAVADKGVEARTKQGVEEQTKISGAKQAVDAEISATESAVNGPPDTEAIEAKRDELLGKLEKTGSEVLASYRSSFEKRTTELTSSANKQKGDVRAAADRQAAAIRRHYPDDPDKGAVESLPTKNWATSAAQAVDTEASRFSTQATTENKGFVETLNDELTTARNTVRDWAAHQEGRERSWWEQLIDMIRDWGKQAVADNEAWERQRAADSRDAMAGDLDALAQLRKAQLSRNDGELNAAMAGLDDEQKMLAVKYLRGQGVDSIGFVAESTMLRIVRRRRGELTESLREEVLRDWDWEQLGILARATNPEFQPKVIANKVKGSIAGIGTSEDKLFAALGTARGPFERAAVEKCYLATFGISMAEDVDDDVDGTEWDRAEALMKGGTADIAVATIADAIDGAGTDEDAIKEALRGKTPAELEEIKRLYKERHGVDLETDLAGDMEDTELDNALALVEGDVAKADAADLEDAMEGAGTDEEKITQVYEKIRKEVEADAKRRGLSVAEMRAEIERRNRAVSDAYTAKYGKRLDVEFADELSGAELTLADALDAGDASRIDAAKAKVEDEAIVYSSDDRLEAVVRNQHSRAELEAKLDLESRRARAAEQLASGDIDKDQFKQVLEQYKQDKEHLADDVAARAKQNMKDLKGEYATMAIGGESAFDVMIEMRTQGHSEDEIKALIEGGGKLSPEDEIYYAIAGTGTDEEKIKETLKGKTPEEIDKIRKAYEAKHGEGSFDDDILSDLSGREDLDTALILEMGDPSTFTAQLSAEKDPAKRAALLAKMERYLEERKKFEQTGSIGSSMLATGTDEMNTVAQMEDALVAARRLDAAIDAAGGDMTNPAVINAQHRMDMNFAGAVEAQEQFRAQIDAYADIAVQIGAAIAGIAVTIATLGAGAPFAVAAMWGAAASAATGIYMNADLRGAAYSWEEAGVDVAVGVVDVAAAGLGAKYFGPLVKQAGMLQIAAGALADGLEGVPSALLEAGLDEAIWASGDPGGALLKIGGVALGTGAALSAGFEVAGGAYGALTGPKVKAGAPSLDVDLGSSTHGGLGDVDVGSPSPGHGVDAPSGKMPELDIPPVADPSLAAGKAGAGELPPGNQSQAPRSPDLPATDGAAIDTPAHGTNATNTANAGGTDVSPSGRTAADSVVDAMPDETVMQPPNPKDHADAQLMYRNSIAESPNREAAIYRNTETGEYIVIQGNEGTVSVGNGEAPHAGGQQQRWKEILDGTDTGRWELQAHSHPVEANGIVDPVNQWPSGANGDMGVVVSEAMASGEARSSRIDYTTADGPNHTDFGFDPAHEKPYWVEVPDGAGGRRTERFKTMEGYHDFIENTVGAPSQGDIPGHMSGSKPTAGDAKPVAPGATTGGPPDPTLNRTQRSELKDLGDRLASHGLGWEDLGLHSEADVRHFFAQYPDSAAAISALERRAREVIGARRAMAEDQGRGPRSNADANAGGKGSATESLTPHADPSVDAGRLPREVGQDGQSQGSWEGERGNSTWASDHPDVIRHTGDGRVEFVDGEPVLAPYAEERVILSQMTGDDGPDFAAARQLLMERYPGRWDSMAHVERWEKRGVADNLGNVLAEQHTWHHEPDVETMSLVPLALHGNVPHEGGASAARRGETPVREPPLTNHPL